jgi:NitT/TauT family transport system substrate-binding protein
MKSMMAGNLRWVIRRFVCATLVLNCAALLASLGCGKSTEKEVAGGPPKVKVCYIGLTCEQPMFAAYEKGFFKEEGLDVEFVKSDWDSMRDGLGLGRFHANHTLIMYLLKPIDEGLDVKLTGGVHSGCLRVQAGINTNIKEVKDLKGKRIGISHMGSPPFLFASRVLAANGLDPKNDVEWVTFPADAMELALDRGQVDAVANAEPIGTLLLGRGKVRKIVDQAHDMPYAKEFCCVTAVNGKWARENPKAAAAVTRAIFKGAKWVAANKTAATALAVEKGYLASTAELNAQAIKDLNYHPGVTAVRNDILQVAKEMKGADFLRPGTDPEELAKRAWLELDGATDEWIESVEVEKVAGGGDPPKMDTDTLKALVSADEGCCRHGCCGGMEFIMQLTGDWSRVRSHSIEPMWEICTPQGVIKIAAQYGP